VHPFNSPGTLENVQASKKQDEFFFKYTSFEDAGTVYRAQINKELAAAGRDGVTTSIVFRSELSGLNPEEFETKQVRVRGCTSERGAGGHILVSPLLGVLSLWPFPWS
jgi:hypothetical protein